MKCEAVPEEPQVEEGEVEYLEEEMEFVDDEVHQDESAPEPSVSDEITVAALKVKGKRGRPKKTATIVKTEKKAKMARLEEKPRTSKAVSKDKKPARSVNRLRRRNLQILFNNTTMIPFKWRGKYMCFYCGVDLYGHEELRKHTIAHGTCSDKDRAIRLVKSNDAEVKIDVSDIVCKRCNERFPNFDEIVEHLIFEHKLPYDKEVTLIIMMYRLVDLKCLLCNEGFDYFGKLITHLNSHSVKSFLCDSCDQRYSKKRDLRAHVRTRHRNEYSCLRCSRVFSTFGELHYHKANAHVSACNICFKTFSSDGKRLKHMNKDHDFEGVLRCGLCTTVMNTKQAFLRHAAKCNIMDESKVDELLLEDDKKEPNVRQVRSNIACILNMSTAMPFKHFMNKFRCFYCPKDFIECDDLKQHTAMEHPLCNIKQKCMRLRNRNEMTIKIDTSSLSCKICCESYSDIDALINHLISEHKTRYDKSIPHLFQSFKLLKNNFACPYCEVNHNYFGTLLKHISKEHANNKIICLYCGTAFRTDANLRAHITRHHRAGRYKCTVCESQFTSRSGLQVHLGAKHSVKFAKCSQCTEKFTSHHHVQKHLIEVHGTGHKCSFCDKLFPKHCSMLSHIKRQHLKEKNVECSVCFEKFFDKHRLKIHMVKHIGARNFHCDVCGKKFLWKKNLRKHMSSHIKHDNSYLQN